MDNLNILVGDNLSRMRKERELSLDQLSKLSDVSKSMLSQIEKGQKAPTITTLWKIATGLNVSLSSLIEDNKPAVQLITCENSKPIIDQDGKYKIFSYLPFDSNSKFEIFKLDIEPNCIHKSTPHTKGVKEYLLISTGVVKMEIQNTTYTISSGQALAFSGDLHHTCINDSDDLATGFIIISYPNS